MMKTFCLCIRILNSILSRTFLVFWSVLKYLIYFIYNYFSKLWRIWLHLKSHISKHNPCGLKLPFRPFVLWYYIHKKKLWNFNEISLIILRCISMFFFFQYKRLCSELQCFWQQSWCNLITTFQAWSFENKQISTKIVS